ncbi:MAG: hypothetical protein LUG60_04590 [Erysipelotrichaceae bacterium]|nr:hypothetical protein [Erysipelotrichaceae bacterium]
MNLYEKRLSKGIMYVFIANLLNMLFNLITNFVLPKYLSVDSYAAVKTFQLYINYVGVFHLGFVDGIYLKYGGKNAEDLNKDSLSTELSTIRIFQFLTTLIAIICSILIKDQILLAFSFAIIPLNMISYFKMLYQAIGEFKKYSRVTNITTALTFLVNMILVFLVKTDSYIIYLIFYVFVDLFIWILLEYYFIKISNINLKLFSFSFKELKDNIKSGFSLMCGNFASFILTGLDRWFVKFTLDVSSFAQYSFSVSIENMLNMVISSVTIPLYNYFCNEKSENKIMLAHKISIVFAVFLISSAFIGEIAIDIVLKSYIDSVQVIYILFAAQAFQIVIKAIYVNLYKVRKQQQIYFYKLFIVIISGAIFNLLCFRVFPVKESYAYGTLLSSILWFLISIWDFDEFKSNYSDTVFLILEVLLFLLCGLKIGALKGFIIYIIVTFILLFVFMRSLVKEVINLCSNFLNKSYKV